MAVVWNGTPEALRRLLESVPAILAGLAPDPYGIARALQMRLGITLLSKIMQAFIVKSRGGTGDDGIRWEPLNPKTIEGRRKGRGGSKAKAKSKKGRKPKPSTRKVDILRDTGRLLRSLTPGTDVPGPEGVIETPPGSVKVGSAVPYASAHHNGVPGRGLPARPLWPKVLPASWLAALTATMKRGLKQALEDVIGRANP